MTSSSQEVFQILKEDGSTSLETTVDLSADQLRFLYRQLSLVRAVDAKSLSLQRQGRIAFYGSSKGQEAAYVGSAYALEERDWIFPHYRGQGAILTRGLGLLEFVSQLIGNSGDRCKGRQNPLSFGCRELNYVTVSSPVASLLPPAVGVAIAARIRRDTIVCLTHFGEGATSTGDFNAAVNFAGVFNAPVIFFCVNNQYAISTPFSRQTAAESIAIKARAYGIEGFRVDGNDVLGVFYATRKAVTRARKGDGPTLIEAVTYRVEAHSTSDDPKRYQDQQEVMLWSRREPIIRFRRFLESRGLWSEADEQKLHTKLDTEIEAAIKAAERMPNPPWRSTFEDVYAELPWHLREQASELEAAHPEL